VTVVTHSPSPYQVELFDEIETLRQFELHAVYLHAKDAQRLWQSPSPRHASVTLGGSAAGDRRALELTDTSDLLVINYYKHPFASDAMQRRARSGGAVCFWGERPQRRALPVLSRLLRKWRLRHLLRSPAHIWGIGGMAVESYRREFGTARTYANIPYFSDLRRFHEASRKPQDHGCVFLFSGALLHRKGVDLLASAFARIAPDFPRARLRVMGSGEMEEIMRQRLGGCPDQVEFTGFRNWEDLHLEYARADVLCVPSRHDGWALVVPEGLAAGLPVIGTNETGAAVEFIRNGENGWLIPQGSEDELYHAMREAAALSAATWSEMSARARESVSHHTLCNGAMRFVEAALAAIADRSSTSNAPETLADTSSR
jgi:glycosyltransferase involved in cell wall biosynthesis